MTDLILHPLGLHLILSAIAFWPATRVLSRAGLPPAWAGWLLLPGLGMAVFATLLAFRRWPNIPPREKPMHPRERARLAREAADALAVSE
jgi:hypothetical protein